MNQLKITSGHVILKWNKSETLHTQSSVVRLRRVKIKWPPRRRSDAKVKTAALTVIAHPAHL